MVVVFGKVQNFLSPPLLTTLIEINLYFTLPRSLRFSFERSLATCLRVSFVQNHTNDLRMIESLLSFIKLPGSCRCLHKHCASTLLRSPVGLLTANQSPCAQREREANSSVEFIFLLFFGVTETLTSRLSSNAD